MSKLPDFTIQDRGYLTPCWVWAKCVMKNGYGRKKQPGTKITWLAHRLYYTMAKGSIPEGLHVDHLCKVKACVNPDHLEAVTQAENNRRAKKFGPRPRVMSQEKADQLRKQRSEGATAVDLAAQYGIEEAYVWTILSRRVWRDGPIYPKFN